MNLTWKMASERRTGT